MSSYNVKGGMKLKKMVLATVPVGGEKKNKKHAGTPVMCEEMASRK